MADVGGRLRTETGYRETIVSSRGKPEAVHLAEATRPAFVLILP
ncbi:hypothetical protein [Cohnella cellulosilytica]|uniref:Uncharacterized protein n=1 Tax=Cohnella cellulosilytica TaxID=986710 RepID=A0ABW2F8Z9_9BACL